MRLEIEITKKPNKTDNRRILAPKDVFELEEVQEIKDSIQEHFLLIGLDRGNHVRKINLMGIGTSARIYIDSKQLIRNAIINAFDKVVFVHNHPSNILEPSNEDKHITNITKRLMEIFNIELLDHIIVTENDYISMEKMKSIDKNYSNDNLKFMDSAFLIEENNNLKQEVKDLNEKLRNSKIYLEEDEEEEM